MLGLVSIEPSDRRVAAFHLAFFLFAVGALAAAREGREGWAIFAAAVAYNAALPIAAVRWVHPRWVHLWGFLLPLSLLQILPDWFLVVRLGTLEFTDLGFPRLGDAIPHYMGLLWIIALFPVLYVGDRIAEARSGEPGRSVLAYLAVAVGSLVVFGASEAILTTTLPIWHAVGDVATFGPVALYVLPAEVWLGVAAFFAWRRVGRDGVSVRVLAALAVMLSYLGALWLFHGLVDGF